MRSLFIDYQPLQKPLKVILGDGRSLQAVGQGNVVLKMNLPNNKINKCTLLGVLLVPELAFNLFSVTSASKKGKLTTFSDLRCEIRGVNLWLVTNGYRDGSLDHRELAHLACSSLDQSESNNYLALKVWALRSWWIAGISQEQNGKWSAI